MAHISSLDQQIIDFLTSYAYEPWAVMAFVFFILVACSFGLPIPEEVCIISMGLVAYIGRNPSEFPPPDQDAQALSLWFAASFTLTVILLSDFIVFSIGRHFGPKLTETSWFRRTVPQRAFRKIRVWMRRYGYWSVATFRFLPGIRFPGHLACGMLKIRPTHFILVDGLAAVLTVPTQIVLIGLYGNYIFSFLTEIKFILIGAGLVALGVFLALRIRAQTSAT